jgi:hypothetical protein
MFYFLKELQINLLVAQIGKMGLRSKIVSATPQNDG